jgi:hypothetical protein
MTLILDDERRIETTRRANKILDGCSYIRHLVAVTFYPRFFSSSEHGVQFKSVLHVLNLLQTPIQRNSVLPRPFFQSLPIVLFKIITLRSSYFSSRDCDTVSSYSYVIVTSYSLTLLKTWDYSILFIEILFAFLKLYKYYGHLTFLHFNTRSNFCSVTPELISDRDDLSWGGESSITEKK